MMINCPKCNLLQPKDQYCAGCGINMESYEPPQKPRWKKILGNWMVQLGLLFLVIFVVVLRDNFIPRTDKTDSRSNLPPVSSTIARDDSVSEPQAVESFQSETESVQNLQGRQAPSEQASLRQNPPPSENSAPQLQKQLSVKVYSITRNGLETLSQSARKLEQGVFIVTDQFATQFRGSNKQEFNSFGNQRKQYQLGEPVNLFIGEQDLETGLNFGFYAQVIVAEDSSPESIKAEVRFWNQLKLDEEPSPPLTFDINMRTQDSAFIVDIGVHDLDFTQEERNLFEGSRKLQILNNEEFMDSLSDIALVLEVK